jgi:hypothetical protein
VRSVYSVPQNSNLCESVQSVVCIIFGRANPAPTAITGTVTMTKRARTAQKTRVPLLFVLKIKTVVFCAFRVFRAKK